METLPVSLLQVLAQTLQIYSLVLIVRVLLSWFPNLDWSNPLLSSVSAITDPYLNAFRGLIPPLGGIDLSALLAFLALNLLQSLVNQSISAFFWSRQQLVVVFRFSR
jgi:YggT family protein